MIAKVLLIVAAMIFFPVCSFSQLTGSVRDSSTGKPVIGANITYSGGERGTISDVQGFFEIEKLDEEEFVVSAIGYKTTTVTVVPGKDHYHINLDPADYSLQEVEVTAFNRSRRLVDVPGSISMIPAGRIEREQPVTVVPVLNQVPGVFAHSGALNTSRITIRGIGARVPYATGKIRAYLNNIPLTNGSGISIVEDIDPSVLERIEIIKGPATSVYGAGLGGTVVMTARNPDLQPNRVSNSFNAGSWDIYRNTLNIDAGTGNMGISINYNHTQSNGYRENNRYRRNGLTAVTQLNPRNNTSITAIFNYTSLKAHIPSSIDSATYVSQPHSAAANWLRTRGYEDYDKLLAGVSAEYDINNSLSANLSLFSTMVREKEMRPFDVLNEDRFSGGTRLKLTWSGTTAAGSWQILGGTELYGENYGYTSHENIGGLGEKGSMISDNREFISWYNIFLQSDLDLPLLKVSAGINMNSSSTNYRDLYTTGPGNPSGRYSYGNIISPRISANYRFFRNNSVFMTISHGFSPPSLAETLTPEGFINPDIKPEKSWNLEAGLRGNLLNNRLFYDVNFFRMQVEDLLVAERVGEDAWVGRNAGESLHKGFEGEFQLILFRSSDSGPGVWWEPDEVILTPNLTLNNFRFTDFTDEGVDYSGNLLPGIPDMVVNTGIYGSLKGGLYANLNFRYVGKIPMNDANNRFYEGHNVINATLGFKTTISDNFETDAFLFAGNITNNKYASMILINAPSFNDTPRRYYYPGNPLNFSAGIKISYRFN